MCDAGGVIMPCTILMALTLKNQSMENVAGHYTEHGAMVQYWFNLGAKISQRASVWRIARKWTNDVFKYRLFDWTVGIITCLSGHHLMT